MDDVTDGKPARHAAQLKKPKIKYMDILQKVADRQISEVTIELDDLDNVSGPPIACSTDTDNGSQV